MNRHAIVTGTSSGIGAALAQVLLEQGWTVHGAARRSAPLEHERYHHAQVDLSDLAALQRHFDEHWAPALGGVEHLALVNNAATLSPLASSNLLGAEALQQAFAVNVVAPMWLSRRCLELDCQRLRIVNLSSGAATSPYPGWAAYCSTKSALRMAGQVLAEELNEVPALKDRDVRVLSYAPHVVRTEMQETIRSADIESFPRRERFEELHRQDQLVAPEDPAGELAGLLTRDELEPYGERRYQPGS